MTGAQRMSFWRKFIHQILAHFLYCLIITFGVYFSFGTWPPVLWKPLVESLEVLSLSGAQNDLKKQNAVEGKTKNA